MLIVESGSQSIDNILRSVHLFNLVCELLPQSIILVMVDSLNSNVLSLRI
jgi:hypothetical protein